MPGLQHQGFYIPNAGDVSNPRMAEPDRVDFNTLAHPLWGVIEDCEITIVGSTAQCQRGGTLLVNGQLVTLRPGTVSLGVGGTQDRFFLIAANAGGDLIAVPGDFAVDPVFPDPPADATVLAAVFAPAGDEPSLAGNVIDKRKFVNKALLTKIGAGEALIRNLNGSGNHYLVDGGGKTTWETDTWMWRESPETLRIHKHLRLEGSLHADGEIWSGGDISAGGNVYGKNLRWGTTPPERELVPGTIWQNPDTGKIYIWNKGKWNELATIESANPAGTVIQSMELPSVMVPLGWIPFDGRIVSETDVPTLFGVQGMQHLIIDNGPDAPRTMRLPNANKLVLVTDWDRQSGVKVSKNVNNLVTLVPANLPGHKHNVKVSLGGAANPRGSVTRAGGHTHNTTPGDGGHEHEVVDPGHKHNGMEMPGQNSYVVALVWGGQNKIDAFFNDRNHTYSVEALEWTAAATTGIRIGTGKSAHSHALTPAGDHDHSVNIDAIPAHPHGVVEDTVGSSTPFDITPEHLTVYSYVRS